MNIILNGASLRSYATAFFAAAAMLIGPEALADPKPKGSKTVSASTITQIYAGKTREWSKGGIYFAPDGTFQQIWDGKVGTGNWFVDRKGNLCRVVNHVRNGYVGPNPNRKDPLCMWHAQARDGEIWQNTDDTKSKSERKEKWWRLVNKNGEVQKLEAGNKIKSAYNRAFKKAGPNPKAVKAEASMQPITSREQFIAMMVGKKLWQTKKDAYVYNADGTYSGSWRGRPFTAKWKWKGQYLCRTVDGDGKEDCQSWKGNGAYFKGTSKKGSGGYWYLSAKR